MEAYDIAVVGSGFAGSLMAMIARRLGRSVVLIEKGRHPRVVIGESSTPLTNLLLEELAARYDLPSLKALAKYGTWQIRYPEIACGLKRGFTFYHHDRNHPTEKAPTREKQLLVAASPHDEIADTHWYRADLDQLLVLQAIELGVCYMDETQLDSALQSEDELRLEGMRGGRKISLRAKFVVDASAPRGFLYRALGLKERDLPAFPETQALYSHFSGVGRLQDQSFGADKDKPPYPIDAAAVHHVFDGGWVWVLQFNNGVTSVGIAATDRVADDLNFAAAAEAWQRMQRQIPAIGKQFETATQRLPFTHIPRMSFRSATIAGDNWALLPSAAGFVDPLMSTGFPLTLLGIERLARIIQEDWCHECLATKLQCYAAQTDSELLATARLVGSLYNNMNDFPVFVALSLIYFAAASFAETARRLGKPDLAQSFLLHDHPIFGPATRSLFERAQQLRTKEESVKLVRDIHKAIEPFNVGGLGRPERRNWYPVDKEDLFQSAWKVGAKAEHISALLQRCGFDS